MDQDIQTAKRIINVSNSTWDKRLYGKLTVKQALLTLFGIIFTLGISITCFVFINIAGGVIALLVFSVILILFNIKQCLLLKCFIYFFKYIFNSKYRYISKLTSSNGVVITKNKKYLFFEINCDPMIGNEQMINFKINDFVDNISQVINWSIINVNLPYSNLTNNREYIIKLIEQYVSNHQIINDDPVLLNLLANKNLIESFINGEYKKNTFLFCCEIAKDVNVKLILEQINNINRNLSYQNFSINAITNKTFEFVKNELLFFNKKISIFPDFIKCDDYFYHFIKIDNLPSFVDQGYLNFLNELANDENYEVNFAINTYNIKSIKKEEKLWENAINFAEAELNRAKKYKDQVEADNNYEAVLEMTSDLVNTKSSTQKYEIVIMIKANSQKEIINAKRRVRNVLKKQYKFELCFSKFNQYALFNDYQRNLFINKPNKRILKILPNNLIAYSYPFFSGNTYLKQGLYLGELFNGNPLYFSLNLGHKENNSAIIVGTTGCGKSTFINFLLKNNMSEQRITTILIDPKGEYSNSDTVLKMNPQIVNLDNTNDLVLNPFELCDMETREAKVEFILTFLKIWFEKNWNLNIKNKLIDAIDHIINHGCFDIVSLYDVLKKNLNNKQEDDYLILQTISKLLPSGVYNYFTKKCEFDVKSKLIIFNISSILTDYSNMNKVKLLLLFKFLKKYIYTTNNLNDDNDKKIQVIVDEFPAIANPTAPFVVTEFVGLIRLVRSYDTSLVLAMQDMVRFESMDAESNESLKSIANNVKHKFIMKMNEQQLEIMNKIWGDSVELSKDESREITMKFSKGDILYLNDANRFYFNGTDPLSKFSPYDTNELWKNIEKDIQDLKNKKPINDTSYELMVIEHENQRCSYELVVIENDDIDDEPIKKIKRIHTSKLEHDEQINLGYKNKKWIAKRIKELNNEKQHERQKIKKANQEIKSYILEIDKDKKWISNPINKNDLKKSKNNNKHRKDN